MAHGSEEKGRGHWEARNIEYVGSCVVNYDMIWVRDSSFEELSELAETGKSKQGTNQDFYSETEKPKRRRPHVTLKERVANLFK